MLLGTKGQRAKPRKRAERGERDGKSVIASVHAALPSVETATHEHAPRIARRRFPKAADECVVVGDESRVPLRVCPAILQRERKCLQIDAPPAVRSMPRERGRDARIVVNRA
jgi:hypothetical protein